MFSKDPLIRLDHGWHFYYCTIGSRFLLEHGTTWGYDPYLMAGYPTDVLDTSDHLIKIAMAAMYALSPEVSYKIAVFLMAAMAPLLFLLGSLWFGMGRSVAIASAMLGTALWWILGGLSLFVTGMTGFQLVSIYGFALAGLFYRYLQSPSVRVSIMLFLGAALGLLIHPGILPIVCLPCGILYLFYFKKLPARGQFIILFTMVFAVAVNLFWIIPFAGNIIYKTGSHPHLQNPLQIVQLLALGMNSYWVVISFLVLAIIAVGLVAAGFRSFWLKGRRDLVISLGISGMTLLFIFLFGSLIPLVRETEPLRFGFPFLCLMVFPGSQGLTNWARSVRNSEIKKTTRIISLIFLAMAILLQLGFVIKEFSKPYRAPFVGMDSKMVSIRDWLSAHTDRRGRILLEDGGPFTNYFTDSYAAAPLAYYSHRELIGGPHWGTHLTTHFADISGFMLFGRLLPLWDEKSLAEYMNFYNIGWVGAFSAPMKKLFDGYPALFRPIDSVNGFQFYEVNRPKTFFIEGSGTVEADYNRLVLKNVSAPGGRVVLGYHWHPRLRVAPPARVVRVMLGKDPVGFVGIVNPQREMTVKTEYLLGN